MSLTYNEILRKMEDEYFEKTNQKAELASDLSLRFQILATQLYSLSQMGDHILKQAFLQTATGAYLSNHCEMRGIKRKVSSKSIGKIRFCVNEPATSDIQIPQGTICSSSRNRLIRFITTKSDVLKASETFVDVSATALLAGTEYDAKPGEITVMIIPPSGIDSVTNPEAFTGGYPGENDSMLRKRTIESFRNMPNGANKQNVVDMVYQLSRALDVNVCRVMPSSNKQGGLRVILRTEDDTLSQNDKEFIALDLADYMLYPYDITVELAKKVPLDYTLNLYVKMGADKENAVASAKAICKEFNENSRIGKVYSLIELGEQIEKIPDVHHFEFETLNGDKIFSPAEDELIYSTSQEVVAYDW